MAVIKAPATNPTTAPATPVQRRPRVIVGRGQSTVSAVTIHRAVRSSWCPRAVTMAPGMRPATVTPGATQKLRSPIRSQRPNRSQVAILPTMEDPA